jgi:hypothetical protein
MPEFGDVAMLLLLLVAVDCYCDVCTGPLMANATCYMFHVDNKHSKKSKHTQGAVMEMG